MVALNSYSDNHIDVIIGEASDPNRWRFTGVYGHPKAEDRHRTWSLLKTLYPRCSLPWLLGGDFNEILSRDEKIGGVPRRYGQMDAFREALDYCSILNISSVGPRFTWRGNRGGDEVLVRLDRFLASNEWLELFPMSRALNLKPSKSDHLPILIEVREKRPRKKKKNKRFRFEELWLRDEDCKRL